MKRNLLTNLTTAFSLLLFIHATGQTKKPATSSWVSINKNGKLVYQKTAKGDQILDFSHAGYMGGGVALPNVPVKIILEPSAGTDDSKRIQKALNSVGALPLLNGFRGTVLLKPGIYSCSTALHFNRSGVVLRGSGSGKNGTEIRMTGGKHAAFLIGGEKVRPRAQDNTSSEPANATKNVETIITQGYVPCGSVSVQVAEPEKFKSGETVDIIKPVTEAWIHFLEMDNLKREGRPQRWIGQNRSFTTRRVIQKIKGNHLFFTVPLADAYDAKYTAPNGTKIIKVNPEERVTQAGVENMHVSCPPLEIAYSEARYSGIRIEGDDCWVKDVFFEETMNTTTLAGNRNTLENVVIKHTYPNLGASKPADFSFEGSQNLVDRCASTGDNTYFVWTSSLVPGPNVVLNSTFHGHGSRLQPHQRWATGLLIDNCTIPEGNIDFPNRGAAGSGHGWTMAWAVAWNNIARNYIIQNPPGTMNWAIGNIGNRMITARLFDSKPLLKEGSFESHGIPVAPQSLYLAQLQERLGKKALLNIGYSSNTIKEFRNKTEKPLPPLRKEIDPILGENLALHRPVTATSMRGPGRTYSPERILDGDPATYWAANDSTRSAVIELDMENPVDIDAASLGEEVSLANRITAYKIEGFVESDWKLLAEGTTVSARKVHHFPKVTAWKVRIVIIDANNYPSLSHIGLYNTSQLQRD